MVDMKEGYEFSVGARVFNDFWNECFWFSVHFMVFYWLRELRRSMRFSISLLRVVVLFSVPSVFVLFSSELSFNSRPRTSPFIRLVISFIEFTIFWHIPALTHHCPMCLQFVSLALVGRVIANPINLRTSHSKCATK